MKATAYRGSRGPRRDMPHQFGFRRRSSSADDGELQRMRVIRDAMYLIVTRSIRRRWWLFMDHPLYHWRFLFGQNLPRQRLHLNGRASRQISM